MEAVTSARSAGAAIFFDPGPRSWTFREPERRRALDELLDSTDVVLMTEVPSLPLLLLFFSGEGGACQSSRSGDVGMQCVGSNCSSGVPLSTLTGRIGMWPMHIAQQHMLALGEERFLVM